MYCYFVFDMCVTISFFLISSINILERNIYVGISYDKHIKAWVFDIFVEFQS